MRAKVFNIAKNPEYGEYKRGLTSMVYKLFDKKILVMLLKMKICPTKNYQRKYKNQVLENLKNRKYNHLLQIIFGVLMVSICN